MLLADYFTSWASLYKRGHVTPVTFNKYRATANKLATWCPVDVRAMTRADYQTFLNTLAELYEEATVNDTHNQVAACLKDAVYDGLLSKDPTYGAHVHGKPHVVKHAMVLNRADTDNLVGLLAPTCLGVDAGIYVCLTTGLRLAEMLGLTPADIKPTYVDVTKTYDYKHKHDGNANFQPTKNTSSVRRVPIDTRTRDILSQWAGQTPAGDSSIFIREGRYPDVWNQRLTKYCAELGIPRITMHGLRHTHASLLLAAGVPIPVIAKRLGHANTITTQRTYLHLIKELEDQGNNQVLTVLTSLGQTKGTPS